MITKKEDALKEAGMPLTHGDAFIKVAKLTKCMIMCRVPGIYAKQLIEEGYASKGFHNKAKSCNWGPMAGFVMGHPLFSKAGLTKEGKKKQWESIKKAKEEGTRETDLFITWDRIRWLLKEELIEILSKYKKEESDFVVKPIMTHCEEKCEVKLVNEASQYRFRLEQRILNVSSDIDAGVYIVQYKENENEKEWINCKALVDRNWDPELSRISFNFNGLAKAAKEIQSKYSSTTQNESIENMPKTKPLKIETEYSRIEGEKIPEYKKASTGDYDLFAVWPDKTDKWTDKDGKTETVDLDKHSVGPRDIEAPPKSITTKEGKERYKKKKGEILKEKGHEDLGNYSPRLAVVRFLLNEVIRYDAGYLGGDMVHHGAESGRPFMDEVDLPFLVFFPPFEGAAQSIYEDKCALVQELAEFKDIIEQMEGYYKVGLNPGWVDALAKEFGNKRYYKRMVIE